MLPFHSSVSKYMLEPGTKPEHFNVCYYMATIKSEFSTYSPGVGLNLSHNIVRLAEELSLQEAVAMCRRLNESL